MGLASFNRMRRERTKAAERTKADDSDHGPAAALALADANFQTFKAAAKKVLGDDMPNTKAEIIAALEAEQDAVQ